MTYQVRNVNGLWVVFLGDEAVTKAFRERSIADDFAAALNAVRAAQEPSG